MDRTFVLPMMSTLALCVTGCTEGGGKAADLIGEWKVTEYEYDGYVYKFPVEYSYRERGETYTSIYGFLLEAKDGGRASFGYYYEYSSTGGYYERYGEYYAGDWEEDKGVFEFDFDDYELKMDCTLDEDDMLCEGKSDGEDIVMELKRKKGKN